MMKHKRIRTQTPKQLYQAYDKSLLLQYLNRKKQGISNENELDDVKNMITAFGGNVDGTLMYLPAEELATLKSTLTQENEQEFYHWLHEKYDQILESKGCGAEKCFLFSACAVRDLYFGRLDNIGKGGDYAIALLDLLEAKKQGKENHEALIHKIGFIPEQIIKNIPKYAIVGFTQKCHRIKRIDTFDSEIITDIFRINLSNAIKVAAKIEGKEIPNQEQNKPILGLWTQKALRKRLPEKQEGENIEPDSKRDKKQTKPESAEENKKTSFEVNTVLESTEAVSPSVF